MDEAARSGAAWPSDDAARVFEALRDKLSVVIADAEVAQLMAHRMDVQTRLARVLKAAWEAEALLADAVRRLDAG